MKTSDKIVAFVAIFISCLALAVSIVQTRLIQKQSHAAVWPRLTNGQGFGPDYFEYSISNEGVGPAIISDIEYTYLDSSFYYIHDLIKYFGTLEARSLGSNFSLDFSYSNIYEGSVLGAGDEIDVYSTKDSSCVQLALKYLTKTDIRVDYCSIYDKCWSMKNDNTVELD